MSQLEGKFAGLARIGVADENAESLKEALFALSVGEFTISIEDVADAATAGLKKYQLSILGPDRPGIINEVTSTLARYQMNLLEMSSDIAAAAMTGSPMFSAEATVEGQADISAIDSLLSKIAVELGVDILLAELDDS